MKAMLVLLAFVGVVSGERILGRSEPVPSDKCVASVISAEDERLYVFSLSEDSVMWHKYQKFEGGWSSWRPLANRRKMGSGPKAIRYPNGTMQVFARGPDRQFYVTTLVDSNTNTWTDWSSPFPNRTFASPPTPVIAPSGACLVFGVATETHTVWYSESTPITSEEFTFSEWANLGGSATSPPTVLVDAEALMHVFVRGVNRGLWHLPEVYTHPESKRWGEWECLGGVLASSPKVPVTLNGANLVEVYGRAADKALWHRGQKSQQNGVGAEWGDWLPLGGVLASGPAVALNDDGMGDVFARATDKSIYYKSQQENENGDVSFSQWKALGGMFTTTPTVVVRADGLIDVFARGVDKAVWHAHQVESNGTRVFSPWHSLGGHTRKFAC